MGDLSARGLASAALLFALFLLPGLRAVVRWDAERRFSWPGRTALGFTASFGVFSAVTGPLILAHLPGRWALLASAAAWLLATLAVFLWPRSPARAAAPAEPAAPEPEPAPALTALPPRAGLASAALCVAALACCWALAGDLFERRLALALCALLFALGGLLLLHGRGRAAWGASEAAPRPVRAVERAAAALACLLLAFALVATTLVVREDADDTLYLSEALVLPEAEAMAAENPVHRGEGLPANLLYDWQSFELWGGLLAQLSGVHPMIVFRTLLAPIALLLALGAAFEILRRMLPRGSLGVGMAIALAYLLFGISSHWTANNYLLPRPAQGKTWLIHLTVPVLVLLVYELVRRPARGTWGLLLLTVFGAVGFAPTAIYLVPSGLWAALLACGVVWPRRRTLGPALAAGAALLPLVAWGLYLAANLDPLVSEAIADRTTRGRWRDDFLFIHLNFAGGGGALELFPLVALPLAALLLATREQRYYAVTFTAMLFATVLNPIAHPLIGGALTGWEGYPRLFWLLPYPLLLGVLAAGLVRASAAWPAPRLAGAAVLAGFLIAMPLAGGVFVFGPGNPSGGDSPAPYHAENAYKIPEPLRQLAELLAREPRHGPAHRILCSERSALNLTPLVPAFDFVFTRDYYTSSSLRFAGRFQEAKERRLLARDFLDGALDPAYAAALLGAHAVRYVIVEDGPSEAVERALERAGFERGPERPPYRLWTRAGDPGQASSSRSGAQMPRSTSSARSAQGYQSRIARVCAQS